MRSHPCEGWNATRGRPLSGHPDTEGDCSMKTTFLAAAAATAMLVAAPAMAAPAAKDKLAQSTTTQSETAAPPTAAKPMKKSTKHTSTKRMKTTRHHKHMSRMEEPRYSSNMR